ncbi:MAG: GNAT family N-acetyltransferase [Clostridia bacterium]|nr:GNAT family N-acetyltransferase [Clostridia bacterium]
MSAYEICPLRTETEMDEKGYVHWKCWHETYQGLMPDEYLKNITLEKCVQMAHRWPQNTFVIKVNGKVVGFSCFGESKDVPGANEIIALYLLKEYHGQKLGYELMKQTVLQFSDKKEAVLWVLDGNDTAIRFYKRFGFEFTGETKTLPFGTELQMRMK